MEVAKFAKVSLLCDLCGLCVSVVFSLEGEAPAEPGEFLDGICRISMIFEVLSRESG